MLSRLESKICPSLDDKIPHCKGKISHTQPACVWRGPACTAQVSCTSNHNQTPGADVARQVTVCLHVELTSGGALKQTSREVSKKQCINGNRGSDLDLNSSHCRGIKAGLSQSVHLRCRKAGCCRVQHSAKTRAEANTSARTTSTPSAPLPPSAPTAGCGAQLEPYPNSTKRWPRSS